MLTDLAGPGVMGSSGCLENENSFTIKQVKDQDSVIAQLATMAEDFTQMVRERWADELGDWLETVQASAHSSLRSLATGIGQDLSAVQAALTLPYSNGQTEGQVTRLKLLKRQMYGRANLDLLRQRVLYAT